MAVPTPLDKALQHPRPPGAARRILVLEHFGSVSAAAEQLDADISQLSKVIRAKERSRPLERGLARALKMRLENLFPEWHGQARALAFQLRPSAEAHIPPTGGKPTDPTINGRRKTRQKPSKHHDRTTTGCVASPLAGAGR